MLWIFLAVQVLDGVLTFAGIRQFGLDIELNVLVATLVQAWGTAGLAAAKMFACACGLILYLTTSHRLLAVAAGAHIGVAVVPWIIVLSAGQL